jgi:hypothetical protein
MAKKPRSPDQAIARFDAIAARLDGHTPSPAAQRVARTAKVAVKRVLLAAGAVAALIWAFVAYGLVIGPIGIWGFLMMLVAAVVVAGVMLARSTEPKRVAYSEQLPTGTVVKQLENLLVRERSALPAPAAGKVDAISRQLPLLESRLGEVDALDPLAQDARRLMGKHLPELIERYERVPAAYRQERDGEGMTVDERLVVSLDAAREALDDIGKKLSRQDLNAFETQGRFIESRYKDNADLKGD